MPLSIAFSIAGSVCGGVAAANVLGSRRRHARRRDVAWAAAAGLISFAVSAVLQAPPSQGLQFASGVFFGVAVVLARSALR